MVELETDAPSRPLAEGDQFEGGTSVLGHSFVGRSQVEEARAGQVLRERVMIGARVESTWTFTTDGGETRVDHRLDVELPRGPLAPIARIVLRRRLAKLQRQSLAGLNDLF